MAVLEDVICPKCRKRYEAVKNSDGTPYDDTCSECLNTQSITEKQKWLNELRENKTLEQRIEWIEEWIYKNKDHSHGYAPPPRF